VNHLSHQLGAVIEDRDPHVFRQRLLDLGKLVLERVGDHGAVLTHQHEAQA